jgi:hypothetical protein
MRLVCYRIASYRSWALPLVGATDYYYIYKRRMGTLATHDWPVGDVVGRARWLVSALAGDRG